MKETRCIYPYTPEWKPVLHFRDFLFPEQTLYAAAYPFEPGIEKYRDCTVPFPEDHFDILMLTDKLSPEEIKRYLAEREQGPGKVEIYHPLFPWGQKGQRSGEKKDARSRLMKSGSQSCKDQLRKIPVPVIFVLSVYEGLDRFAVEIALRKGLMERGYAVSQIGSGPYCEALGFHSFPDFMLDHQLGEEEKVVTLNHYIYQMVQEEGCDAVIIGIPGAIEKLNLEFPMGFGIIPYLVSQAVTPDFAVLCSFYNEINNEKFIEFISKVVQYKFGFTIDCFHMSGASIEMEDTKETYQLTYSWEPDEKVQEMLDKNGKSGDIVIQNVYSEAGEKAIVEKMLSALTPPYEEIEIEWE